jgi:hypothetical protein
MPPWVFRRYVTDRSFFALQIKAMRPDFAYVVLDGKGAHLIYDDPEPWADAIAGFVKR